MAGAIAGTAILNCELCNTLHTVALTINNSCNLRCPHCYLQYDGPNDSITPHVLSLLSSSTFRHLAIVGKEPLVNSKSVNICVDLALASRSLGRTVSLITNGTNLSTLVGSQAHLFSWIDVSFDGGPSTYKAYRRGQYHSVIDAVRKLATIGYDHINALHVLNDRTVRELDDLMHVSEDATFQTIMFSPYLVTMNDGHNTVRPVSLIDILSRLRRCAPFMNNDSALLLIDCFHLDAENLSASMFAQTTDAMNMRHKVKIIADDPIAYGIIRLTYDGLALPPSDSLHPAQYAKNGSPISTANTVELQDVFQEQLRRHTRLHAN